MQTALAGHRAADGAGRRTALRGHVRRRLRGRDPPRAGAGRRRRRAGAADASAAGRACCFHAGRVAGYAVAGAAAAAAVQGLALASAQIAALRPAWMLLHVFVLAWGLLLLAAGRQPAWVASRRALVCGTAAAHDAAAPSACWRTGALWVAMPCGLLYSALMLARRWATACSRARCRWRCSPWAAPLSLLLAPWLWRRLRAGGRPAVAAMGHAAGGRAARRSGAAGAVDGSRAPDRDLVPLSRAGFTTPHIRRRALARRAS